MISKMLTLTIFFSLLSASCISVDLGRSKTIRRSTGIRLEKPKAPFNEVESPGSEQAWRSSETGNMVTYVSECVTGYDPSLEELWREIAQSLRVVKVEASQELDFQSRRAVKNRFIADVDGVESDVEILFLKKNGCIYNFTYISTPKDFAKEHQVFKNFLSRVRIE